MPLEHNPGTPKIPKNEMTSFIHWWLRVWDMFQEYLLMGVNYPPWNKQQGLLPLKIKGFGRWSGILVGFGPFSHQTVSFQAGYHFTRWATTSRFTSYNTYTAFRRPGRASPCSGQNKTPRHFPRPAIVSFVEALRQPKWHGRVKSCPFFRGNGHPTLKRESL